MSSSDVIKYGDMPKVNENPQKEYGPTTMTTFEDILGSRSKRLADHVLVTEVYSYPILTAAYYRRWDSFIILLTIVCQ